MCPTKRQASEVNPAPTDCLGDQKANKPIPHGLYVTTLFGTGPLQTEVARMLPGVETGVKGSFPGTVTHKLSLDTEEVDPADKTLRGPSGQDKTAQETTQVTG